MCHGNGRSKSGLFVILGLALCASRVNARAPDATLFSYDPAQLAFHCHLIASHVRYRQFQVTFGSQVLTDYPANNTVYGWLYLPMRPQPVPAVIVLHVLKTRKADFSRALCKHLASRGIAALLVALPYHLRRTPPGFDSGELFVIADTRQLVQTVIQAVVDTRCAVDFLQSRPEIVTDRIGIVGASLGAMVALLAAQVDGRFCAAVSLLGTTDPAYVLWHSELVGNVKNALRSKGYDEASIREELAPIDAAQYVREGRQCALLMINGRHDWVMPRSAVKRTWEVLGRPYLIWINTGHFTGLAHRHKLYAETSKFLRIQLGLQPGPYRPAQIATANLKVGLLSGKRTGTTSAVMAELPLESRGRVAIEAGVTGRGPFAGISGRPIEHLSIGYGALIGKGRPRGQVYWMFHTTF